MSSEGETNFSRRRSFKDLDLNLGAGQTAEESSDDAAEAYSGFDTGSDNENAGEESAAPPPSSASTAMAGAAPPVKRQTVPPVEKHATFRIGASQQMIEPGGKPPAARFMTEEQYLSSMGESSNARQLLIISITGAILVLYFGYTGYIKAGPKGAAFTLAGAAITLLVLVGLSFVVAKIVGALFGENFGGFVELFTKVSAFALAYDVVMIGVSMFVGSLFGLLFGPPVVLVLAAWLIGMDFFQSLVFAIASVAIKFMIVKILAGVLLSAVASMG